MSYAKLAGLPPIYGLCEFYSETDSCALDFLRKCLA